MITGLDYFKNLFNYVVIISQKDYIDNMSPRNAQDILISLKNELINLDRSLSMVDSIDKLMEVRKNYIDWQFRLKDFINQNKLAEECAFLWLDDLVISDQISKGGCGIIFGDERSLFVLKNLRKQIREISLRLDHLPALSNLTKEITNKNIKEDGSDLIKIKNKKVDFSFNIITGDTQLNGINTNFKPKQQKFNIIYTILNSENFQADYLSICNSVGYDDSKINRRYIQGIVKDIKKDLKILPKSKKSNCNIFENIEKFGYRILDK